MIREKIALFAILYQGRVRNIGVIGFSSMSGSLVLEEQWVGYWRYHQCEPPSLSVATRVLTIHSHSKTYQK